MPRTLSVFAVRLLAIDGSGRKAVERSERVVAIPSRFAFFSLPFPSPFARGAILFSLLFSPFFSQGCDAGDYRCGEFDGNRQSIDAGGLRCRDRRPFPFSARSPTCLAVLYFARGTRKRAAMASLRPFPPILNNNLQKTGGTDRRSRMMGGGGA